MNKVLNPKQKEAVEHKDGPCCVLAAAGSGKTKVLTERIHKLTQEYNIAPENVVAVTFTSKAGKEMKSRLALKFGKGDEVVAQMSDQEMLDAFFTMAQDKGLPEENLSDAPIEAIKAALIPYISEKRSAHILSRLAVGTFHSVCWRVTQNFWRQMNDPRLRAKPAQDWETKKWIKEILGPVTKENPEALNWEMDPAVALNWIGHQKANLLGPNDNLIIPEEKNFLRQKYCDLYRLYEQKKANAGKIDFDDMLLFHHQLLTKYPPALAWCQNRFQYILVDEFQDTNLAQSEILKLWAGDRKNIFVVGDDKQSLYRFRSAEVGIIIGFKEDWQAKQIVLDTNYRSTKNIIELANRLISYNENQVQEARKSVANRSEGADPIFFEAEDEDEEAAKIVSEIETLTNKDSEVNPTPRSYKDIAVLYRTNAQSRAIEDRLMNAKIPYIVVGSIGFYGRKEIKDMIAYLQVIHNPNDDEALDRILNVPNRYFGQVFRKELSNIALELGISSFEALQKGKRLTGVKPMQKKKAVEFAELIREIQYDCKGHPAKAIQLVRKLTKYDEWLLKEEGSSAEDDDRIENLNTLQLSCERYSNIPEFLAYVNEVTKSMADAEKEGEQADRVQIMTIHRSKGLEWPVVFVSGASEGLLPHRRAVLPADIEEERRCGYVAVTRARDVIYVSWFNQYQKKKSGASEFIAEMMSKPARTKGCLSRQEQKAVEESNDMQKNFSILSDNVNKTIDEPSTFELQ